MEANASANDVNNRVYCAHFMKMNLFQRHAMHAGLRLSQLGENGGSAVANWPSQSRICQHFENGAERAMLLLILRFHLDVGRGHALLADFLRGKLPSRNLQAAKLRAQ